MTDSLRGSFNILLDGELQRHVKAYDADAGWLVRYRTRDGRMFIENGEAATERREGKIEVRWK